MTEQLRAQTLTFCSTLGHGPGAGRKKKEVKKPFLTLPVITLGVTTSCKIYTNYIFDFIVRMNSYDVK